MSNKKEKTHSNQEDRLKINTSFEEAIQILLNSEPKKEEKKEITKK